MTALLESFDVCNFTDKLQSSWTEVSPENLCQFCNKPDWCCVSGDGRAVLCGRTEIPLPGWREIKKSRDGRPIYVLEEGNKNFNRRTSPRKITTKQKSPNPFGVKLPEGEIELLKLSSAATDIPQPQERHDARHGGQCFETTHRYSDTQWVTRVDRTNFDAASYQPGKKKVFGLWHTGESGQPVPKKGDRPWPAYQEAEAIEVLEKCKGLPVLLVQEGEGCVEAARAIGLVSITFQGSSWTEKTVMERLEQIKSVVKKDFIVASLIDNDDAGQAHADKFLKAAEKIGLVGLGIPGLAICEDLPLKGDIKQILERMEPNEFIARLEREIHAAVEARRQEQQQKTDKNGGDDDGGDKIPPLIKNYELIAEAWLDKLRFNELKQCVELDGEKLSMEGLRLRIALETGVVVGRDDAVDIVLGLAKNNSYHPVEEYLDRVYKESEDQDTSILDNLAERYFGSTDPLHNTFIKRHLIASVARVFEPGCKVDTALILQGKQGVGKSSFFRALYSDGWFDDTMSNSSDKDELLKMLQHWAIEWSELENVFKKREVAAVKAFMSTQIDNIRVPYGRSVEAFPRTSVLVGSTNEVNFLSDPTGSRRFWTIPVKKVIPLQLLREERDRIWAAAVQAYFNDEQWWLTNEESALLATNNEQFQTRDSWADYVETYVVDRDFITTAQVLEFSDLKVEPARQDRSAQNRVAAILQQLGWQATRRYIGSKRVRGWEKPHPEPQQQTQSVTPTPEPQIEPEPQPEQQPSVDDAIAGQAIVDVVDFLNSCDTLEDFAEIKGVVEETCEKNNDTRRAVWQRLSEEKRSQLKDWAHQLKQSTSEKSNLNQSEQQQLPMELSQISQGLHGDYNPINS